MCQKSSRSLKPFDHNTPTLQTDGRTDGRISYGIGLDLTVGQKHLQTDHSSYLFIVVVANSNHLHSTEVNKCPSMHGIGVNLVILLLLCYLSTVFAGSPAYALEYESPESCKRLEENGVHYYFNVTKLGCKPCSQNASFQTVSDDGLFYILSYLSFRWLRKIYFTILREYSRNVRSAKFHILRENSR